MEVPIPKEQRRRSAAPQAVKEESTKQTPDRPTIPKPEQFEFMYPEEGSGAGPHAGARGRTIIDDEGRLYACVGGRLVAIRYENEKFSVDWIYSTDSHIPGNPALGPDGNIRVHAGDGSLHCITRDGRQAWAPARVGEPLGWSSPLVDAKGNTWICSYLGGLLKINDEGQTSDRPYFRTRQKFDSTGVIHQGVFYVGGEDGFIYAIEMASGRRGRNVWDHNKGAGKTDWFINSQLLTGGDGTLIVASRDDCLYGFQPGGELAWKTEMPGQILASPVLDARGDIYLGLNCAARDTTEQGRLVCVRGNSHKIAWQFATAAAIESTPVVDGDGVVYVGDNSGLVHAVDRDGAEQWQAQLAAPVRSAGAIIAPGRVAFGLDDDTLIVLKCS